MKTEKTTFALFFGNRGFFPASHIADLSAVAPSVTRRRRRKPPSAER